MRPAAGNMALSTITDFALYAGMAMDIAGMAINLPQPLPEDPVIADTSLSTENKLWMADSGCSKAIYADRYLIFDY